MNTKDKARTLLMEVHQATCLQVMNGEPRVFRSPVLTERLLSAIANIAPHLYLRPDERSRNIWEVDQNAASCLEFTALEPVVRRSSTARVLEIGPGLGRSIVYFANKFGWSDTCIDAYEASGAAITYPLNGARSEDSFCGDLASLYEVLCFNGLHEVTIHDARMVTLRDLPGPYDLIYSFFGVGYHWRVEDFLEDLSIVMHQRSLAVFTSQSANPPRVTGFRYRTVPLRCFWPVRGPLFLLLVEKLSGSTL